MRDKRTPKDVCGEAKREALFRYRKIQFPEIEVDCKTVRIFAYSNTRDQSNKRSGTRLKTEIEESRACEARTKLRHALPITDFEKKNRLFCSLKESRKFKILECQKIQKALAGSLQQMRHASCIRNLSSLFTGVQSLRSF